jgi:hypothetical protein
MSTGAGFQTLASHTADNYGSGILSRVRLHFSAIRIGPSTWHYWLTFALAVMLLPLGAVTRLSFAPPVYLLALFLKVAFGSTILAAILHVVDTPLSKTIAAFGQRPVRLAPPAVMGCVLVTMFGWSTGLLFSAATFVVVEFLYRHPKHRLRLVCSVLFPALYLLVVIILICYYNAIATSVRNPGAYDHAFMRLDAWFGFNVPSMSRLATETFPPQLLSWAETTYFGMFNILGATLILIALNGGVWRAMRFVGGVALAYYLTLAVFMVFPSQGPYSLCLDHASSFPSGLHSYSIHFALLDEAARLYQHSSTMLTSGGYFISFPCMHVVKPTLALWYLRAHKRIGFLLAAYLLVLPVAIILLEMHYFVDIPVGFAIAAIMIFVSDSEALQPVARLVKDYLHAVLSPKRPDRISSPLS